MKKFLVVVDTQYDFVMPNGKLYVKGAEQIIVPGIEFLANLNPQAYEGVLFTFDTHTPKVYTGSPESELFPIHCVSGTPGWQNVFNKDIIHRDIKVWGLEKGVFNMWEEPNEELFHEAWMGDAESHKLVNRDVFFESLPKTSTLIEVFGVASDYCVKQAVDGFVERGFAVAVIDQLCQGINLTTKEVFDTAQYIGNVAVRNG